MYIRLYEGFTHNCIASDDWIKQYYYYYYYFEQVIADIVNI